MELLIKIKCESSPGSQTQSSSPKSFQPNKKMCSDMNNLELKDEIKKEEGKTSDEREGGLARDRPTRWIFSRDDILLRTPSRVAGISFDNETSLRREAAKFMLELGDKQSLNGHCINTAIAYIHRFYMLHPFTLFDLKRMSVAALFLSSKTTEQRIYLEKLVRVGHYLMAGTVVERGSDAYATLLEELITNECILIQTLGFNLDVTHPHCHVVKFCNSMRAEKAFAQECYYLATCSLHFTTYCLEYTPSILACICIQAASKRFNHTIPRSKDGKDWFWYIDKTLTFDKLRRYANEFITIYERVPSSLKQKVRVALQNRSANTSSASTSPNEPLSPQDNVPTP